MAFREDMISSSASCSGSEEEDEFDERGAAGGYDPMAGGWKSLHSAISRASLRQLTRTEKSGSTGFKAKSCTATRARHEEVRPYEGQSEEVERKTRFNFSPVSSSALKQVLPVKRGSGPTDNIKEFQQTVAALKASLTGTLGTTDEEPSTSKEKKPKGKSKNASSKDKKKKKKKTPTNIESKKKTNKNRPVGILKRAKSPPKSPSKSTVKGIKATKDVRASGGHESRPTSASTASCSSIKSRGSSAKSDRSRSNSKPPKSSSKPSSKKIRITSSKKLTITLPRPKKTKKIKPKVKKVKPKKKKKLGGRKKKK